MEVFQTAAFNPTPLIPRLATLNERQKELVQLLLECRKREDIARFYGISIKGLDWHIYRLFEAMGVKCIVQLVIVATKANFVHPVAPRIEPAAPPRIEPIKPVELPILDAPPIQDPRIEPPKVAPPKPPEPAPMLPPKPSPQKLRQQLADYLLNVIARDCFHAQHNHAFAYWANKVRHNGMSPDDWFQLENIIRTFATRLKKDYNTAINLCNSRVASHISIAWIINGLLTI